MQISHVTAPPAAPAIAAAPRLTGTVAYFNQQQGFGFVTFDAGRGAGVRHAFIGADAIRRDLWSTISAGDRVAFDLLDAVDAKGYPLAAAVVEL